MRFLRFIAGPLPSTLVTDMLATGWNRMTETYTSSICEYVKMSYNLYDANFRNFRYSCFVYGNTSKYILSEVSAKSSSTIIEIRHNFTSLALLRRLALYDVCSAFYCANGGCSSENVTIEYYAKRNVIPSNYLTAIHIKSSLPDISEKMTITNYETKHLINHVSFIVPYGLLFFLFVLLFGFYIYKKEIRRKLRTLFIMRCGNKEILLQNEKEFDVFICYSENERIWVNKQLLRRLNDKGISCCTHDKDFVPGLPILDNILNFMEKSSRIIFIVNRSFIKNKWGQFELEIARQKAIRTKKDSGVLVILKEDIAVSEMPEVLRSIWCYTTCLKWPNQNENRAVEKSWKRLLKVFTKNIKDIDGKNNRSKIL